MIGCHGHLGGEAQGMGRGDTAAHQPLSALLQDHQLSDFGHVTWAMHEHERQLDRCALALLHQNSSTAQPIPLHS